jgi:hypothetical protein
MGKLTISMAIFNSKLLNYQRVWDLCFIQETWGCEWNGFMIMVNTDWWLIMVDNGDEFMVNNGDFRIFWTWNTCIISPFFDGKFGQPTGWILMEIWWLLYTVYGWFIYWLVYFPPTDQLYFVWLLFSCLDSFRSHRFHGSTWLQPPVSGSVFVDECESRPFSMRIVTF